MIYSKCAIAELESSETITYLYTSCTSDLFVEPIRGLCQTFASHEFRRLSRQDGGTCAMRERKFDFCILPPQSTPSPAVRAPWDPLSPVPRDNNAPEPLCGVGG